MGIECQYKDHFENDDNSYIYTESRIKKKLGTNLASFIESLLLYLIRINYLQKEISLRKWRRSRWEVRTKPEPEIENPVS